MHIFGRGILICGLGIHDHYYLCHRLLATTKLYSGRKQASAVICGATDDEPPALSFSVRASAPLSISNSKGHMTLNYCVPEHTLPSRESPQPSDNISSRTEYLPPSATRHSPTVQSVATFAIPPRLCDARDLQPAGLPTTHIAASVEYRETSIHALRRDITPALTGPSHIFPPFFCFQYLISAQF